MGVESRSEIYVIESRFEVTHLCELRTDSIWMSLTSTPHSHIITRILGRCAKSRNDMLQPFTKHESDLVCPHRSERCLIGYSSMNMSNTRCSTGYDIMAMMLPMWMLNQPLSGERDVRVLGGMEVDSAVGHGSTDHVDEWWSEPRVAPERQMSRMIRLLSKASGSGAYRALIR